MNRAADRYVEWAAELTWKANCIMESGLSFFDLNAVLPSPFSYSIKFMRRESMADLNCPLAASISALLASESLKSTDHKTVEFTIYLSPLQCVGSNARQTSTRAFSWHNAFRTLRKFGSGANFRVSKNA